MVDAEAGDLTARARIRDAALRLFAERGMDAATIRDIAAEAGVSLGLVRHHFGAKEALRDACDEYVLTRSKQIIAESTGSSAPLRPGFLPATHPTLVLFNRYFARALVDGSPNATAMFDELLAVTETWIARQYTDIEDPRAFAVLLTAMELGPLVMHQQVSRGLGVDALSAEGHIRVTRALIDIHSRPLLDADLAASGKAAYDELAKDTE